jgi:hypothetical protein
LSLRLALRILLQVAGRCPETPKLFVKSLTQNLQNKLLASRGTIFRFAETKCTLFGSR